MRITYSFKLIVSIFFLCFCVSSCNQKPVSNEGIKVKQEDPNWPIPDNFVEVLKKNGLQPSDHVSSLRLRPSSPLTSTTYVVLPVQTQGSGFSLEIRSIAGALLDSRLNRIGIEATSQTEVLDANGPFVRRFEEKEIQRLMQEYPRQKFLMLYLGKSNEELFLTLEKRDSKGSIKAHKSLPLPNSIETLFEVIDTTSLMLLKELGFNEKEKVEIPEKVDMTCSANSWDFKIEKSRNNSLESACYSLAVGTLLPVYEQGGRNDSMSLVSPAKFAWLAHAFVQAQRLSSNSKTATTLRGLAARQLNLDYSDEETISGRAQADPILSFVSTLLNYTSSQGTETRKDLALRKKALTKLMEKMPQVLPTSTKNFFLERGLYNDDFRQVDICTLEAQMEHVFPDSFCPSVESIEGSAKNKVFTSAEFILHQEWQLASVYKSLRIWGQTLSVAAKAKAMYKDLPASFANHPFLRQLSFANASNEKFEGTLEQQLIQARENHREFLQATVDLQRENVWHNTHSLSEHDSANLAISNDNRIIGASRREHSLLSTIKSDHFLVKTAKSELSRNPALSPSSPQAASVNTSESRKILFPLRGKSINFLPKEELINRITKFPGSMNLRLNLAIMDLKEGRSIQEAIKVIDAYPAIKERLEQSHAWADAGNLFFSAGEVEIARRYFKKSLAIGTGSESEMRSQVVLDMISGKRDATLLSMESRMQRYGTDYARRDLASMQFMMNLKEEGWKTLQPRLATTGEVHIFDAAIIGHKMAGMNLASVNDWLLESNLEKSSLDDYYTVEFYQHLYATTDRLPSDSDIQLLKSELKKPLPNFQPKNESWAISASLIKSALSGDQITMSHQYALSKLSYSNSDYRFYFISPFYAWIAWQATKGKDEHLEQFRDVDLFHNFDVVLTKSMILALEGKHKESLKYLNAARYELTKTANPSFNDIGASQTYHYALGAYLMYKETKDIAYRNALLKFLKAQEILRPYYGWIYSMQAVLETNKSLREKAACRAKFLDPQSYFLSISGIDQAKLICKLPL